MFFRNFLGFSSETRSEIDNGGLSAMHGAAMSIVEILLCIFLPPVAVAMKKGAGADLIINILLWVFLFGLGGIIHAFWVLNKK
ncbi:YqaE/Pmp3 family membrane protein [Cerasicoccus maritimus]|uniref:YqaE/Pmp3 family membrane protein n=1 Tax=Cerasicoccus maritimus TaxID=490089 RepID=UPI002852770C|nr:YqaE/Pmp3 family membrane protein [Cerasicoccus maritimus]